MTPHERLPRRVKATVRALNRRGTTELTAVYRSLVMLLVPGEIHPVPAYPAAQVEVRATLHPRAAELVVLGKMTRFPDGIINVTKTERFRNILVQ